MEHIKALVEVHHVDIEEIYPDKPRMKITPLFDAARKNRYKIAEYLLSVGAKIDQENSEGMTPIAAYRRYKELTTLFIEQGADVSGKITNGTYRPTCKPNKSGRQLRPPQRMQTRTVEKSGCMFCIWYRRTPRDKSFCASLHLNPIFHSYLCR